MFMTRILVVLGLGALFAGGALAASNVPKLPILAAAEETTSTATTTTEGTTTTSTGSTTTGTTGTTTTGTSNIVTTTTGTTTTGTRTTNAISASETGATKAHKVVLCHKTGSKKNSGVQIEVSRNALPAHLAH